MHVSFTVGSGPVSWDDDANTTCWVGSEEDMVMLLDGARDGKPPPVVARKKAGRNKKKAAEEEEGPVRIAPALGARLHIGGGGDGWSGDIEASEGGIVYR